jgi:hypothetical protein
MHADQNRQLQQAFFGGAWVALQESTALAPLPEDQAVLCLEAMHRECQAFCQAAADARRRDEG